MNIPEASLILRMEIALVNEGIGADDPQSEDPTILTEALRVAGHLIEPVSLHYAGLITDAEYATRTEALKRKR